jgi:hypothetical protein
MRAHNKQFMSPVKSTGWDLRSAALHASPIIGRYAQIEMAQKKVNCDNCSKPILETTAIMNNGLCAPCKSKLDISIEYQEKLRKKKRNSRTNHKKGKLLAILFVWSFIFFVLCGGIYVNYQEYIKDEEQN